MRTNKPVSHPFLIAVYRWLLRAFPAGFRAEFEEEMVAVFAALLRLAAVGEVIFA